MSNCNCPPPTHTHRGVFQESLLCGQVGMDGRTTAQLSSGVTEVLCGPFQSETAVRAVTTWQGPRHHRHGFVGALSGRQRG